MKEHDLTELLVPRWRQTGHPASRAEGPGDDEPLSRAGDGPGCGARRPAGPPAAPVEDTGLVPIRSPMVGTFYTASDPTASPMSAPGSEVGADTVVCIIEAMKVFNEIKAELAGTVEKVMVQNAQPVEFGQPLFMVRLRK